MATLSTDQALYNITKAYLDYCVSNRLYWDTFSTIETGRDYHTDKATYQTMRQAYLDCNVITWEDFESAWFYNMELKRPVS